MQQCDNAAVYSSNWFIIGQHSSGTASRYLFASNVHCTPGAVLIVINFLMLCFIFQSRKGPIVLVLVHGLYSSQYQQQQQLHTIRSNEKEQVSVVTSYTCYHLINSKTVSEFRPIHSSNSISWSISPARIIFARYIQLCGTPALVAGGRYYVNISQAHHDTHADIAFKPTIRVIKLKYDTTAL